jgi:hypothetical protein
VELAEAKAELAMIQIVVDAAISDPSSARWWLERRRYKDWAARAQLTLDIKQMVANLAAETGLPVGALADEVQVLLSAHGANAD